MARPAEWSRGGLWTEDKHAHGGCLAVHRTGYRMREATAATTARRQTFRRFAAMDVRQVVMTLSEYERRTETERRRDEPGFADRMDLTAANMPTVGRC